MAKRKPAQAIYPPEYGVSVGGLFMELFEFSQSTNELGKNIDPISTLILSLVCVSEADGQPMTADDIAFFFDIPRKQAVTKLNRLIKDGSISQDGDRYRYDPKRRLTETELARVEEMQRRFEKLRPLLEKMEPRLDS
jgi:hypothetical protein